MRRLSVMRTVRMKFFCQPNICLLLLAAFYLLGGFLAIVCTRYCSTEVSLAIKTFLSNFCSEYDSTHFTFSIPRSFILYFGGILFSFFLGFSSLGCVLIPLISGLMGFSSFYSVACFACAMGAGGVLAAAALIAVRLIFTLPCFLFVSVYSLRLSYRLAALLFGRSASKDRFDYPKQYFFLFLCCLIILCVGVFCERFVTPQLFRSVISRFDVLL